MNLNNQVVQIHSYLILILHDTSLTPLTMASITSGLSKYFDLPPGLKTQHGVTKKQPINADKNLGNGVRHNLFA